MLRTKVVVALYPFRAIEGGDLSLEKVNKVLSTVPEDSFICGSYCTANG